MGYGYYYGQGMMYQNPFLHLFLGILGFVGTVLFWTIVIFIIIKLFKRLRMHEEVKSDDSALDLLKKRYAKGELTKKEFQEMKKDISE
jgi:putative membrane protein